MKIIYFYNEEWEKEYMGKALAEHEVVFYQGTIEEHASVSGPNAEVLSVFVNSKINSEVLARFPKLKYIATRSTGFDHIDLASTSGKGIVVSNVPTYGENTVAEFAFALILALSRKVPDAYDRVRREGNFSQNGLRGFDLLGKTLGVVGTGHIGRFSISIAKGFGMNVLAFDVKQDETYAKEAGFSYVSLDELLAGSDIVTLHAPYNEHTHHMLNHENMSQIKKGAYLINTARGGLVETNALVSALKDGTLAGAGLDVFEEEGYFINDDTSLLLAEHPEAERLKTILENQYLIDHPNVIMTPHNAFQTQEALERILQTTTENITAFANGAPANLVVIKK